MKVIDLLNKIANGEIKDKTKFRIYFSNNMHRDIYYDDEEQNQLCCLKNISDDYSIYDDICLLDEVEIIEDTPEEKKIPKKLGKIDDNDGYIDQNDVIKIGKKVDEIIDYLKSKGDE